MRSLPSFFEWSLNLSCATYLTFSNNSRGQLDLFAQKVGDYSREAIVLNVFV